VEREIADVETRIRRIVDAIAAGGAVDELVSRLKSERTRREVLGTEMAGLADVGDVASLDRVRLLARLKERAADVLTALALNTPQARQMFRKLLNDQKIALEPGVNDQGRRGLRFVGVAGYDRLLTGTDRPRSTHGGGPNGIRTRV
jgi:hypothetical protein